MSSLNFELPANLSVEKFIAQLNHKFSTQLVSKQYAIKTYYDSFDWRLYSNGLIAEFIRTKTSSILALTDLNGHPEATAEMQEVPAFSQSFLDPAVRDLLQPLLEMRALLAVCTVDYDNYQISLLNNNKKTVLRLILEKHSLFNSRVILMPIKGYDKVLDQAIGLFTEAGLTQTGQPLLLGALKLQGRSPLDYSSKLNIALAPGLRADTASKTIYRHLLKTMKANEQGTVSQIDSEFLHDFRVAVRRTRAGLSQIKGVFPSKITARFSEFFSWLGQITTPTRDLDVYLLNFGQYKNSLPESIREDLNPLYDFLKLRQHQAQKQLAKKLRSNKYLSTLVQWEQFLISAAPKNSGAEHAGLPIKELADRRILKVYKRVLKQGNAITEASPAETLHDLRKTCKKLRYLIEFFQGLYPEQQLKPLLKNLKALQEVLGDFQDYEVQEQHLKIFSSEMMALGIPANTFLAMGVLIQMLDERRNQARNHFAASFHAFKSEHHQTVFSA